MKKHFIYFSILLFTSSIHTSQLHASINTKLDSGSLSKTETSVLTTQSAASMTLRVKEIKKMDKTTMSSSEKKLLRKEVRAINYEQAKRGGGVYLSVGAVVIILLLLIILL